jgi:nucleoside-diphosphate-sugar epimerase
MRVLVTGGTGVVGKPAIDHLLEHGHQVRLLSRSAAEDVRLWAQGVEAYPASVGDAESLHGAADGCDAVLHIAGIVREDPPEATFERVNVQGTRNLLAEARRASVRRFIYVSSLGAERGDSDYHRSKVAAEEAVRGYSGEWLILRPGNVYGAGDEVISLLLKMVRTLPAVPVIGGGDQRFQPIYAEDLGEALAMAVERDHLQGEVLELGGEEITTTSDLLDRLERVTGKSPPRIPVPEFLAQTGAGVAETLGIEVPVNSDQLVMLSEENVLTKPNALVETFGITPTPLDEGLTRLADELPAKLPREGRGKLHRQRYWADIHGSRLDRQALLQMVRDEFYSLPPEGLLQVGVEPGSAGVIDEGATLTLAIPLRGNVQVRVMEVTDEAITFVTVEGHPLSGAIRFMAMEDGPAIRFEIRSYTRATDLIDLIGMRTVGSVAQEATWKKVVEEVVERSGGEAPEGVRSEEVTLEGADARGVEEWVEDLVMTHEREQTAEDIEEAQRGDGRAT